MTAHEPTPRLAAVLARLDARIDWERRDRSAGMRVSLEPARDLVERLGRPALDLPCVHVTGSKGKGSVSALVAAGLTAAGLRVGRYSSPHVERMNERVVIDGEPVGDEALARALERVLEVREEAEVEGTPAGEASWFDLVTGAALLVFREAGVDFVVMEVGLGGRLDSTNVVRGEVCVVTSIGLEHTTVLGPTRVHIVREKAGILKPGSALVSGVVPGAREEDDPGSELVRRARELDIEPIVVPEAARGPVPERNRALAAAVLDELGRRGFAGPRGALGAHLLTPDVLAAAVLPGRREWRFLDEIPVLLDGAHTPESVELLLEEGLAQRPVPPVVVLSLGRDKDADRILKALAGRVDSLLCTAASGLHRTAPDLRDLALERELPAEAVSEPSEALQEAARRVRPGGWILVTGSLYVVGAVRGSLRPPPAATEKPA